MLLLIFACILASLITLSLAMAGPIRAVQKELRDTPARAGLLGNPLLRSVVACVAKLHGDKPSSFRSKLAAKLRYASYPSGITSAVEFIAFANVCGFTVAFALFVTLLAIGKLSVGSAVFLLLVGAMAILFTYSWLASAVETRRVNISRQYPYFLDLAVMSMEAGASFTDVIEIYSSDNDTLDLAQELQWVLKEMQMGSTLREALTALAGRLASNEIRQSVNAVVQGQRMGTPLGQLLREQAESIRFRRSQMAERAAEEIKVKITGPVILMMLAVFILILGPAVINVMNSGIL